MPRTIPPTRQELNQFILDMARAPSITPTLYDQGQELARRIGSLVLKNGPIEVNIETRKCTIHDIPVRLTNRERDLLVYLLRHVGENCKADDILRTVWGPAHIGNDQYLRVYISNLRWKLIEHKAGHVIKSVPTVGYRIEVLP